MEHKIIQSGKIMIAGMVFYGDPFAVGGGWSEENEIGKLWTRFSAFCDNHRKAFKHEVNANVGWELHITTDEYDETKEYYVMVGIEVSEIEDLPAPTFAKALPAGQYAVFTLKGEQMTGNWSKAIYEEWLPLSAYEEAYSCTFERCDDDRFKGWGDPESEVEIWVPVKAKE